MPTKLPISPAAPSPSPPTTSPPERCICGGSGWYKEAVPVGHPRFGTLLPCVCKLAEQAAKRQAEQETRAAAALADMRSDMGELGGKTFGSFDATWDASYRDVLQVALARTKTYARAPGAHWLFLTGPTGSGKSHLAAAVANHLARQGRIGFYRSVPSMIKSLREGYASGSFDQRLNALCNVSVLVLDDLGAENRSEANNDLLFEIINHRAMREPLTTIITSNCELYPALSRPFFPSIEPRISSRIKMRAILVDVIANDYRAHLGARLAS